MAGWLTRSCADVPRNVDWLGHRERGVLAGLRVERRRQDWLLGRWTAKAAVGAWMSVAPERLEILAAPDGAPEAWLGGARAPVSLSLSHRAGRSLAAVGSPPEAVGCDLERVEPRSGPFVREWLAPAEQGLIAVYGESRRPCLANLAWAAKEAAAKARREGLRLDVRHAVSAPAGAGSPAGAWRSLRVDWDDGHAASEGWWREEEPGWVMALVGDPRAGRPEELP